MSTPEGLLFEHRDGISTITFNRPDRLNSLSPDLVVAFQQLVSEVDLEESTRAIVLTGAGRGFCAGADVNTFGTHHDTRVNRRGWHLVHRLLEVEKPIIAMINGPAAGLGMTIALLCDIMIMADEATIGDPHVNLGLVAGDGVASVLPLLIGPHRSKELLLTGRNVRGTEAAAMGLVNRSVPSGQLHEVTYALAAQLAAQPVYAARATKMVLNRYVRWMASQILDTSLAYEAISRELPEYPEAVAKWKARRNPGKPTG